MSLTVLNTSTIGAKSHKDVQFPLVQQYASNLGQLEYAPPSRPL